MYRGFVIVNYKVARALLVEPLTLLLPANIKSAVALKNLTKFYKKITEIYICGIKNGSAFFIPI